MADTVTQIVDGGLRVAPPVTVSAASIMGLGLDEWMYIATILYTVLQGSYLAYKWRQAHRKHKERKNGTKNYRNRAGFSGETGDSVVPEKGRGDPE